MNFLLHNRFCFILELKIPYQSIPRFFIFGYLVWVADRRLFQNLSLEELEAFKECIVLVFDYLVCAADGCTFQNLSFEDFEALKEPFGYLCEWKTR